MAVSIAEARERVEELLEQSQKKAVVIRRERGPSSVIISYERFQQMEEDQAYLDMLRIREELRGVDINLQELLDESRRELEERTERIIGEND
jgi:PHD/YefM family antitoxin component YafN of YafNO toxin-antitoxin module